MTKATSAVENSGLSYPLNAMSLFSSHLQVNVPGLPLSVMTDINFVPVRLKVSVDNSEVGNPSASLLDILVGLNYAFNVTDSGISVAPGFGVRLTSLNVDTETDAFKAFNDQWRNKGYILPRIYKDLFKHRSLKEQLERIKEYHFPIRDLICSGVARKLMNIVNDWIKCFGIK